MNELNIKDYTISQDATVLEALQKLNRLSGRTMTLFALDTAGGVKGTLTDGDVRRALIDGCTLQSRVSQIMHVAFMAFRGDRPDIESIREIRHKKIALVPHINTNGTIRHIYDFSIYHSILPIDAVLMAGGRGERLRPLTLDTPKPLLPVGNRCIIDHNVEALIRNGITDISVTVNYLAEKIEQHFAKPMAGVQVKCVREPRRLGTIGSLSLVERGNNSTVLVMNSDLLTNINYEAMYLTHIEDNADMTVAVIPYVVSVPYAIFRTEGNNVLSLEEKPTYNYYANAGIYMIRRSCTDIIPQNTYYDATDFIETLIARGGKVRQYVIDGTWIDIGSPDDYRAAQELMRRRSSMSIAT